MEEEIEKTSGEKVKRSKLSLKDGLTLLIAFFGLLGVLISIMQVQKQISNQVKQIQIQQKQFDKQLCDTRFSSSIELLGNQNESIRIGGAYSLYFLANDYKEYLNPVCEILCENIHHKLLKNILPPGTKYENIEEYLEFDYTRRRISREIQIFLYLLFSKENQNRELIFDGCIKKLRGVHIEKIDFNYTTLSNVDFSDTDLNFIGFKDAKLSNVDFLSKEYLGSASLGVFDFENATLSNVNFGGSRLTEGKFINAKLSNVDFFNATLIPIETVPGTAVNFENSTLHNVSFKSAKLVGSKFINAIFSNVDFTEAIFEGEIDFTGTVLDGYSNKEITRPGRSLELTKTKDENGN